MNEEVCFWHADKNGSFLQVDQVDIIILGVCIQTAIEKVHMFTPDGIDTRFTWKWTEPDIEKENFSLLKSKIKQNQNYRGLYKPIFHLSPLTLKH